MKVVDASLNLSEGEGVLPGCEGMMVRDKNGAEAPFDARCTVRYPTGKRQLELVLQANTNNVVGRFASCTSVVA